MTALPYQRTRKCFV